MCVLAGCKVCAGGISDPFIHMMSQAQLFKATV